MGSKKENLPLTISQDNDTSGTITYANEVIAIIAGVAANEVDGVAGMCSGGSLSEVFGKNKNITKGVKVELGSEEVAVDLFLVVEYGTPIQTAAFNVQENVRKALESMTGLHVVRVDVHVQGVSFEKERKETQASLEKYGQTESLAESEPMPVEFDGEPTPMEEHKPVHYELEDLKEGQSENAAVLEEVPPEEVPEEVKSEISDEIPEESFEESPEEEEIPAETETAEETAEETVTVD